LADIANLYSPFTFGLLPLSTGSSLPFLRSLLSLSLDQYTLTSSQHCDPADSMEIHRLMGCERTLGMHWGTFCDSDEARGTRVEFGRVRRMKGVGKKWVGDGEGESGEGKGRFVVADVGETLVFP
jgi:N-acyl-phosphatidylethanolamine-hydrolysing phospholipase D